ncbi:surface layer protein [Aeropyrum pernix K1]|uniref:Surface layer protein n=1 Tax=Aeropyrum pernix (strain ATCC 700893 / DSM 11879 / JCM 9820 / NBRC 100138 / K1) TaxID=272557 RepID=Q9YEG7_AERPE|nr:surface layer protein [Aeropyrum pernix]BAA79579.2 surface layer protein [Aeropyrum pernix K1]
MRIVSIAIAALMVALFTLPTVLPIAQAAQDVIPAQTIEPGFDEPLVIDLDQMQDMVALTIVGQGFQDASGLTFEIWRIVGERTSFGVYDFTTPIAVYGGDNQARLRYVLGEWVEDPSDLTPPTLVIDMEDITAETGETVTVGPYELRIKDEAGNVGRIEFTVADLVSGAPTITALNPYATVEDARMEIDHGLLSGDPPTDTIFDIDPMYEGYVLPIYRPGDEVEFSVGNIPGTTERIYVYLDWVGSGNSVRISPGETGTLRLPKELPMGIHLLIAVIYYEDAGERHATLAFTPIYIIPKLFEAEPFVIEGDAGETISLDIRGLPFSTQVGNDIDGDGSLEVGWLENPFSGTGNTFDLIIDGPVSTTERGSLSVTTVLEDDIEGQDRGSLDLYLYVRGGDSTIVWNHDVEPDLHVVTEIKFPAALVASRPDVPPDSFTYGDSGLVVYVDGDPLTSANSPLEIPGCSDSIVEVVVFNTMARATVSIYLGPFLLGTVTTDSRGAAKLTVNLAEIGPLPDADATGDMDYAFTAVAVRGGFYDNINMDNEDGIFIDIVPTYFVDVGETAFYFEDGGIWAGNGTQFIITICGVEPFETVTITEEIDLESSASTVVADSRGVAQYVHIAPDIENTGKDVTVIAQDSDNDTSAYFSTVLEYKVPELLTFNTSYEIDSTALGTIKYSTDKPGNSLNSGTTDTLEIDADNTGYVVPGLTYEVYIGDTVVEVDGQDIISNEPYPLDTVAPGEPGVYPLTIKAQGFSFIEEGLYYLVVSDPLSLEPQIIQVYPMESEILAGPPGGVLFAAFNYTDEDSIEIRSPTITTPGSTPASFDVIADTGVTVTLSGDEYVVGVDDNGAVMYTVENFQTPATTHTLHMQGGLGGLFTFNIELVPHWKVTILNTDIDGDGVSEVAASGENVQVQVIAHGAKSGGLYKVVLVKPGTEDPLVSLAGETFESAAFQASVDGTINATVTVAPELINVALASMFEAVVVDVQTGQVVARSLNLAEVVPAIGSNAMLSTYILTPLTPLKLYVSFTPFSSLTDPVDDDPSATFADDTIVAVTVQVSVKTLAGATLFTTVGTAISYYDFVNNTFANPYDASTLSGAIFLVLIPNYDKSLAGQYVKIVIDKIVVQTVENDSDLTNPTPEFHLVPDTIDYTLGVVRLGADGGVLSIVDLSSVEEGISEVKSIVLAIQDDLTVIDTKLDSIEATVTEINEGVAILQTDLGNLQASVDELTELLQQTGEEITMKLDEISGDLAEISNGVATIQGDVATILELLDAMNATLTTIQGDVAEIKTTAGTILVSVQDLQTIVADSTDAVIKAVEDNVALVLDGQQLILESLDTLDAKITAVSDGVAEVQTILGDVSVSLEDLVEANATIEEVVVENNQLLATITTSMGTLTADMSTLKDLIESGVNVKLDQVLEDLSTISDQNAQLAAQAEAIAQTLAAVQDDTAKITDIQSTLASVAGDVASVKQDTSTISSKLDDANGKLDSISSKVDSVSSAVADIQEQLGQVGDTAESASGRAQTWGIINAVLSLAVLGVAGYLVLQLTRRE